MVDVPCIKDRIYRIGEICTKVVGVRQKNEIGNNARKEDDDK